LVELLVVIGIIAMLVGILLPTLNRARSAASLVACQANMKQVGTGLLMYAAENKGSLPYMLYYPRGQAGSGLPPGGVSTGTPVVWWASLVQHSFTKTRTSGESPDSQRWPWTWNKAFRCVEADSDLWTWPTQFQPNPIAMPNPVFEANPGASTSNARNPRHVYGFTTGLATAAPYPNNTTNPLRPAKISQLYPDNVLLWETNQDNNPYDYTPWFPWQFNAGWGISGIDEGRLLNPAQPSLRYRPRGADPFATIPNRAISSSIAMPTRASIVSGDPRVREVNSDSFLGLITPYMIGGARFRHKRDTVCNVFFADGSVRGLVLTNKVEYTSALGRASRASDFKRYMLLIKYPNNRR
jgi:prepilin-type processing-associated H-X9-DG protein